jgi:hypothetical protein
MTEQPKNLEISEIKKDQPAEEMAVSEVKTLDQKSDDAIIIEPKKLQVKPGGNIIIGTLNIFATPAKKRYHRFYHPQDNNYWFLHLIADAILFLAVLGILAFNVYLQFRPDANFYGANYQFINNQNLLDQAIKQPKLALEIKKEVESLNPGEKVNYILTYRNGEKFTLQDVVITANIEGEFWGEKNKLVWSKDEIPVLASLAPNQNGEIKFSSQLKPQVKQVSVDQKKFVLALWAEAVYRPKFNHQQELFVASGKVLQKISTQLTLNAFARYYSPEGDQLGFGPLPSIVGQTTKYWLFFNLENNYNDAQNILVTAKLPDNVSWTGKISTTEDRPVEYNPNNRQVNWRVSRVPAPSEFYPSIGAAFEVAIIPSADQIGQTANLLTNIQINATDSFTGQKIEQNQANITTLLTDDSKAKSDGKIR